MAFNIPKKNEVSHSDPESLFRDLRSRRVEGLLSQQADTLREYVKNLKETDLALELPTGSGKTLVGLLIAEWRRIKFGKPVLFVCPTTQLVHQVVEQAREKYGIEAISFTGSKYDYAPENKANFINCKTIGVTNYSSLFNSSPFFDKLGTIIFDDAHAAENYVSKCWSLEVDQNKPKHLSLFEAILNVISPLIPEHDRMSFQNEEDQPFDSQWVNHLPVAKMMSIKSSLMSVIDEYAEDADLHYVWKLLRENINGCLFYYTNKSFLIRPLVPPTEYFSSFESADQRIYMSATLGEGGDLERLFGTHRIKRIPAPPGWDKQGIGRRFFLLPMCRWTEQESKELAVRWIPKFGRALIISPSKAESRFYKELVEEELGPIGYSTYGATDMEKSKSSFVASPKAVAILANRYDGIDLNGDECRYLVVSGLPEATNLQERFLMSRMAAGIMFRTRVRTRITQAVGRCTRSSTDWALVVVIGEKAQNYFMSPENRRRLHPEFQAELEFGLHQSGFDDTDSVDKNIDAFSLQNADWKEADRYIIETRDGLNADTESCSDVLSETVKDEVKFANAIWNEDYSEALSRAIDVASKLGGSELRGYRAWWYYLAGNAAFLLGTSQKGKASIEEAKRQYANAASAAPTVAWMKQLGDMIGGGASSEPSPEAEVSEVLERMEQQFEKIGKSTNRKLEAKFKSVRDGLLSKEANEFEEAQVILGQLMGYISRNSSDDSAPDPWWILRTGKGLVFEDYTATTSERPLIGKNKVIQAKGHLEWLAHEHPGVEFLVVLCSTTGEVTHDSSRFASNVAYLSASEMRSFAEDCITAIRALWDRFTTPADLVWRQHAVEFLSESKLLPDDVITRLTKVSLSELHK